MFWYLVLIIVLLAAVVVFDWYITDSDFKKIPGPRELLLVGNGLDFLMDRVKFFYRFRMLANKYKRLFKLKLGSLKCVCICDPVDVEVVIASTKHNTKGMLYYFLRPWLQDGLLISDGAKWQHRRKILTPTFHFNILKHFQIILEENSRHLVEILANEVDKSQTDISTLISDFALNSICETAMGIKLDGDDSKLGNRYKNGVYSLGEMLVYRVQRFWIYPESIFKFTKMGKMQESVLKLLTSFRENVINKKRETFKVEDSEEDVAGKKRLALLDLLLRSEREGNIDAKGIGEEVDTFMFEGHDTTSIALQFALMRLANHPEIQERAVQECTKIFGSSDRAPTTSDLAEMKYLECCIKETLRLYPPVYFFTRILNSDVQLKNYYLKAGTECAILVFDMHRRADQFVDPLDFKPERFLVEPTWNSYAFIPFSAGPRNCIGQKFAMLEMKLALSAILRRYRILPVTKPEEVVFIADFLLRTTEHIYVKLENRN